MELLALSAAIFVSALVLAFALVKSRGKSEPDPVAEARQTALDDQLARMATAQAELTGKLQMLAETQAAGQDKLARTMNERLDQVTQRMSHTLSESATKTAQSLGQINNRLTVIDEAQKNITELSGQVVGLQDILANKQARGSFGEIQMEDLVRNALPPSAFIFQATLSSGKRADCLIHLPNPPGSIAIDSKFPLESFHALRNAENDGEKKAAIARFRTDVSKHVKDIAERYIIPGETAESALMFLPSEAIYAELHTNFIDVLEKSYAARVWIVSPTTLMATLNTVRAVLKDAKMKEQAHLIQAEVSKMMNDIGRLNKRVGNLKSHFNQAEEDIKQIEISTGKISKTGEKIENVQLEDNDNSPTLVAE